MTPNKKLSAAALGGAVAIVLVWLLTALTGVEVPAAVATAFGTICTFAAGYLTPDA